MNWMKCRRRSTIVFVFSAFFILAIFTYDHTHYRHRRLHETEIKISIVQNRSDLVSPTLLPLTVSTQEIGNSSSVEATILFWTAYYGLDPFQDNGFIMSNLTYPNCFDNCRIVRNRSVFKNSDAVIFHSRDLRRSQMPSIRPSDQIWIYLQQESPIYTERNLDEFKSVFNWTMTYRKDSDVYHPYFKTFPMNTSGVLIPSFFLNYSSPHLHLQEKTNLIAWVVSHCDTKAKREKYVDRLKSFIPIDIYGSCGKIPCSRGAEGGCLPQIARQYKFYLSFENSLCEEYITEKFSNALQYGMVPVVYGRRDYSAVAPPGSFINANDFGNPKALADYLLFLDTNPEQYLQYFQWKTQYKIVTGDGWCSLCRQVIQQKIAPVQKIYENLSKWWYYRNSSKINGPICHHPSPHRKKLPGFIFG